MSAHVCPTAQESPGGERGRGGAGCLSPWSGYLCDRRSEEGETKGDWRQLRTKCRQPMHDGNTISDCKQRESPNLPSCVTPANGKRGCTLAPASAPDPSSNGSRATGRQTERRMSVQSINALWSLERREQRRQRQQQVSSSCRAATEDHRSPTADKPRVLRSPPSTSLFLSSSCDNATETVRMHVSEGNYCRIHDARADMPNG